MHNKIRNNDEYYCKTCGLTWDIHEEEPAQCIDRNHRVGNETLKNIKEVLNNASQKD